MSSFPTQAVPVADVTAAANAQYTTAQLNRKFVGLPLGCFRGFNPQVNPVNDQQLLLNPDATFSDHVASGEASGGYPLAVRTTGVYLLDFTSQPLTDFPIQVYAEFKYTAPPAGSTDVTIKTASIKTVGAINALVPVAGLREVAADSGVLTAGTLSVVEGDVVEYTGAVWQKLFPAVIRITRVRKPAAGPIVVAALGTQGQTDVTSDTFVPAWRQEPVAFSGITFGYMPGGSYEDLQAAILTTSEVDAGRTGTPITVRGTVSFTNGSTAVTGAQTLFLSQLQATDQIKGTDNVYYEIASIADNLNLVLSTPYLGATSSVTNTTRIRTWPSLDNRLDAEAPAAGLDGLQARIVKMARLVEGTPRPAIADPSPGSLPGWAAAGSTANVSSDFLTVPLSISDADKGAVAQDISASAGPSNAVYNLVLVRDADYNEIGDPATDYARVYGRLTYDSATLRQLPAIASPAAVLQFTNGVVGVSSATSIFLTQLQPGDIIRAPDGAFRTVKRIYSDTLLDLDASYSGPTATVTGPERRRWTINFKKHVAGVEGVYNFPPSSGFRYQYHRLDGADDRVPYDSVVLEQNLPGKSAPNLPDATTTIKGKVLLAADLENSATKVPTAADSRINAPISHPGKARKPQIQFATSGGASVVVDDTNPSILLVTISAPSATTGFPGFSVTPPPADSGAGAVGSSSTAAHGDHVHPLSSAYKSSSFDVRGQLVSATGIGATNVDLNFSFTPKAIIFVGQGGTQFCAAIAAGSGASDQAHVSLGSPSSFYQTGRIFKDNGGTEFSVLTFGATTTITRNSGSVTLDLSALAVGGS